MICVPRTTGGCSFYALQLAHVQQQIHELREEVPAMVDASIREALRPVNGGEAAARIIATLSALRCADHPPTTATELRHLKEVVAAVRDELLAQLEVRTDRYRGA